MTPNPEDAFDDENAPDIPQLGDAGVRGDISDEARQRAAQEAAQQNRTPETQEFLDTIFGGSSGGGSAEEERIDRGIRAAQSVGISANGEGGTIGQLLEEVRAIRSVIESLLNS